MHNILATRNGRPPDVRPLTLATLPSPHSAKNIEHAPRWTQKPPQPLTVSAPFPLLALLEYPTISKRYPPSPP